jgi:DNA-binding winged helix-turn-helix (wHTH) protein
VEENTLNQHISTLRRVSGENRGENRFIATPGRGYRFILEVNTLFSRASENEEENAKQVRIGVLPFENIGAGEERSI